MVESVDAAPAASPKKTKATKAKKPKTAPSHPPVSEMVTAAISTLKERGGSSLVAIKKYVSAQYKVDSDKLSPFIKKYLKSSVVSGGLVQTKGKGASGSFKIGGGAKEKSATKPKAAATKAVKPKKAKASPKKAPKPKKVAAKPKKAPAAKKAKPAKKAASPKKPKAVKLAAKTKKAQSIAEKEASSKKGQEINIFVNSL